MRQDIQTFSDLLDIDSSELLEVNVKLKRHGSAAFIFSINDKTFTDLNIVRRYPINEMLTFGCVTVVSEARSAIEIESIRINDCEVLPLYQHLGSPPKVYFDTSVRWEYKLDRPFYPWYHEITGQGWIA